MDIHIESFEIKSKIRDEQQQKKVAISYKNTIELELLIDKYLDKKIKDITKI